MAAEPDFGMDRADMKKLLVRSKKEPVHCGLGLTKAGVVLMMDKIKQPKALVKELEKKFADMKSPHWGTAFVDVDEDPKLVILSLNKAAPGMARRMKKTLKGTGFSKVEIRLEDGSVADKVGEEDEEDEEGAPAAPGAAAAKPAEPQAAPASPAAEAPAAPQEQAKPAGPSIEQLTDDLKQLVKQMIEMMKTDPSRAGALKQLAAQGQACIKSGDVQGTQDAIKQLKEELSAPKAQNGAAPAASPPPASGTPAPPNMAALDKARQAWTATRTKVESELGKLHKEMTATYKDHGFGAQLDRVFQSKVEPMLHSLDDSLSHKLDEVTKNKDPGQHAKLIGEAKQIVQRYEKFLASEPLIAKLDKNPFVELHIEKTLTGSLEVMNKTLAA
jgi:hypothetical protein